MITIDIDKVRAALPDAQLQQNGSIRAVCYLCQLEGHHAKQITIFANGAISCSRFASAGREANREHCAPIRELLEIDDSRREAFISEILFDGRLTIECTPADRDKVKLIARNGDAKTVLNRDVISLDKAKERADFIKGIQGFDTEERKAIDQALKQLADRYDRVQAAIDEDEDEDKPNEKVISKILPDGRVIEQVAGGMFAVYDPTKGDISYTRKVETDYAVYRPLDDDFILKGGLFLPDRLIEYGDVKTLDAEIEACIHRYSDVSDRERKLSAKYARLSYLADKLNEISYLRATGERGSGKSRYICTTGMLCLRPILVTSPSAASLYRSMDAYQPTLTIDECNLAVNSDDTQMLVQVLNSGFQRITFISRCEKGPDGQMTVRMFSPFGPKLIGGLKLSESEAFESRCVSVKLQKTGRKDIPFRLTDRMLRDFAELRAKLYLWRLRNLGIDIEQALDDAERELKSYNIEPRFVQIAIPIYGMIDDKSLKADFAKMMEGRTDEAKDDKKETLDGQLVDMIHSRLFDIDDDGNASWKVKGDLPELIEGEPCEGLRTAFLTDELNRDVLQKKQIKAQNLGRYYLKPLGFQTRQLSRGAYKRQMAVVYSRCTFANVFKNFSLPVPRDIASTASTQDLSASDSMKCGVEARNNDESCLDSANDGNKESCGRVEAVEAEIQEPREEEFHELASTQFAALDTETEPFDDRRGITPRTAKMIGLSLSWDGAERTTYETDPMAWALLMPEDQTVIFHNSKFDLRKLEQNSLPLPEKWEDTQIAAHLLDETGEHGLKPLAKIHLGIDDPVTFEEADRMRMLDPDIFVEYAKNDSRYTFQLWPRFEREIERQGLRQVYELEKAVVPAVIAMEDAGMRIDLSRMSEMRDAVKAECDRLEAEIYDHAGCKFDIASPQKTATILYEKLGLPCTKETSTGQESVSREALEEIRGLHPAVETILNYREVDKLASTFLDVLPKFADERGRIHPEFKPLGPTSGRFSCKNPNVQQIPSRSELGKKLRTMFVADPGNVLVCADWSQMEMRILAHYSKDPLLLEAYNSVDEKDLHTLTASRMFGKAESEVTKPERSIAKMINFGIAYGITAIGLFNRLRPQGVNVTQEHCEQFINDYFRTYAGVKKFLSKVESVVRERGYVMSMFKRRRRVSGQNRREIRQAQNFIIQGTAADLAKDALVRLHGSLPEGARLIAMVHDEFIVECTPEQSESVSALMTEAMQKTPEDFSIPLLVDAKIGANWGECK
jgi:DNA polymerase I-like protein with 3'-5' exonuclease and polymerase domains